MSVAPWTTWPDCPCGCSVTGLKLQTRHADDQGRFHVVGCVCRSCIGRRNRKKGQAAQRRMHQALGGEGFTPSHEETARPYTVEVTVMPESKTGDQVPASFAKFIRTDWFRRALDQATRSAPVGSGVRPALVIDGKWLIVDVRQRWEVPA